MTTAAYQFNAATMDPSAEYRRKARHLRYVHRDDPAQLQQFLRRLASEQGLAAAPQTVAPVLPRSPAAVFAAEAAGLMDGPVLRYSNRLRLLQRAGQLGIGRFEANLIIATLQHRAQHPQEMETPRAERGVWKALTAALAVECVAAVAGWWFILA